MLLDRPCGVPLDGERRVQLATGPVTGGGT